MDSFFWKISSIPPSVQKKMLGVTWHEGCPVGFDQLAYLTISYHGFDNKIHKGELIVNKEVAKETIDIFKKLFDAHFPIEEMSLPENLMNLHNTPPTDEEIKDYSRKNNTIGFVCRPDAQTPTQLSMHSFGYAIDINPRYNPGALPHDKVTPEDGKPYLNRTLNHPGMIKENDNTFKAFTEKGWEWGGFFRAGVDYMHFQKVITQYYMVNSLKYLPPDKRIK